MPKEPKQPSYIPPAELQTVERYFNGLPIREARGDIIVQPTPRDLAKSVPNSPTHCAYAIFLKRAYNCPKVFIFETTAYVQTKDERGNPIVERFIIKDHAASYIRKFDNGEPVSSAGFVLHKPTPGKELEHKRRKSRQWYLKNKEHARDVARKAYQKRRKSPVPREIEVQSVRKGTGCVKFIGTYDGRISPKS